ncbi:MAG: serine/threonine-protein kinase [Myxococcota bacterium]
MSDRGTTSGRALGHGEPTHLGKFTLVEPIGQGGMAQLYLGRTAGIGGFVKEVVVKRILPHLAQDAEFIARFIQEARLAATLDHPNIASVYEVDVDDDVYFYSMEYVRGRDLRQVLRRMAERGERVQLDEVVAIVSALCAGLAHAHEKRGLDGEPLGIVHRDVSPSNVLVGFEGAVKLTDFGVAKARTGLVSTDAGALRGKLPYMSPEQCRGEAIDRRSDVYAVGALMWEMLTSQRLHRAETDVGLIQRIAHAQVESIRALRPDCPEAFDEIVQRTLSPDPATRYPSAAKLRDDLEEFARCHALTVSASTVARLMANVFGDEERSKLEAAARDPTEGTATATATVEPDVGASARVMTNVDSIAVTRLRGSLDRTEPPTVSEDGPTRHLDAAVSHDSSPATDPDDDPTVDFMTSRSPARGRIVGAVVLGAALGLGGLYVYGDGDQSSSVPEPASEPASSSAPPPSPASEPSVAAAAEPGADAAEGEPGAVQPEAAPVTAEPAEPAATKSTRKPKKSRRRRSKKPTDAKPINLDSAMPPGLSE